MDRTKLLISLPRAVTSAVHRHRFKNDVELTVLGPDGTPLKRVKIKPVDDQEIGPTSP